jgi:hypothetical protein
MVQTDSAVEAGTWDVNGDTLLLGTEQDPARFCQDGDTLRIETIPVEADDPTVIYVFSRN